MSDDSRKEGTAVDLEAQSDARLLALWTGSRDEAALGILFARYRPMIQATAHRLLRDQASVDDVIQETFIELTQQAATITGPVAGWLRGVAGKMAISHLRSHRRRQGREAMVTRTGSGANQDDDGQHAELIAECIAALTPAERDLILRLFWEGHSQKKIASELNVSPVTIHKRARSVLDHLRRMLDQRGGRIGTAALAAGLSQLSGAEPARITWLQADHPHKPTSSSGAAGGATVAIGAVAAGLIATSLVVGSFAASRPERRPEQGPVICDDAPPAVAPTPVPAVPPPAPAPPAQAAALHLPRFCQYAVDDGWQPSDPATWRYWQADGQQTPQADDPLQHAGGSMSMRYHAGLRMYMTIPIPAEHTIGHQIHLEFRMDDDGDDGPWRERIFTTLRSWAPPDGDVVFIASVLDHAAGGMMPPILASDLTLSKRWIATVKIDTQRSVGFLAPWCQTAASLLRPTQATTWPIGISARCSVRQVQVRALTPAQRSELTALVATFRARIEEARRDNRPPPWTME